MPVTSVYGLRVRSPLALPGTRLPDDSPADVVVHVGSRPDGALAWSEAGEGVFYESEHADGAVPSLVADRPGRSGLLRLRYAEGIRFHVSARGDEVWCDWAPPMTEQDAVAFLLGPVVGSVLRRRGLVALHASAVVIGGGAWAFVGPGGSGKSTLAAAFALAGYPLLAEDVVALRRTGAGWEIAPAYSGIRLWDDAAALVAQGRPLPAVTPTWPKRELDLASHGLPFARDASPLLGLFVLEDFLADEAPPRVTPMRASDLLVELVANVYANYVADGAELARELGALAPLAEAVPGWLLAPGGGSAGLDATRDAVVSHAKARYG